MENTLDWFIQFVLVQIKLLLPNHVLKSYHVYVTSECNYIDLSNPWANFSIFIKPSCEMHKSSLFCYKCASLRYKTYLSGSQTSYALNFINVSWQIKHNNSKNHVNNHGTYTDTWVFPQTPKQYSLHNYTSPWSPLMQHARYQISHKLCLILHRQ